MPTLPSPGTAASGAPSSPPDATSVMPELTPRSKIRALMAQVGDDSDEEAPESPSKRRKPLADVPDRANRLGAASVAAEKQDEQGQTIKKAVEIRGARSDTHDVGHAQDQQTTEENAYERVRARMINGALSKATPKPAADDKEGTDGEDDDIVIPKGRMAARLQAGGKEVEPLVSRQSSPALPGTQTTPISQRSMPEPDNHGPADNPFRAGRFLLRKKVQFDDVSPGAELQDAAAPSSSQSGSAYAEAAISSPNASNSNEPGASNSRFLELVARKRQEREAKEAEEERLREEKLARLREELEARSPTPPQKAKKSKKNLQFRESSAPLADFMDDDPEIDAEAEAEIGARLTQQSRPTRKASKKALEEMSRETQRLSRNMQLAHEARTAKKISKESLLAKFNFRGARSNAPTPATSISAAQTTAVDKGAHSSAPSSSAPASDGEGAREHQTPPSSPVHASPGARKDTQAHAATLTDSLMTVEQADEKNALSITSADFVAIQNPQYDEKLAIPRAKDPAAGPAAPSRQGFGQRAIKVYAVTPAAYPHGNDDNSDSGLEVMTPRRSRALAALSRAQPAASKGVEGKALLTLRALAQLGSPGKKAAKPGSNPAVLAASLRKQARQQAAREREDKIRDLEARGIIVRTEEEREHDQAQMEDILEKARRENDELARREKDARRKEALAKGEELPSSDDDEEYEEGDEEEQLELEMSGSEDEEECDDIKDDADADEDEEGVESAPAESGLIMDQAAETEDESEADAITEATGESDDEDLAAPVSGHRRTRGPRVIEDDEDEEDEEGAPFLSITQATPARVPVNPFLQLDSAIKDAPAGVAPSFSAPMGLTQAFAATMADWEDAAPTDSQEQDSLAALRALPAPDFDFALPVSLENTGLSPDSGPAVELHFSQSQIQTEDSLQLRDSQPTATQTDMPEPTQDAGFGLSSPAARRFASIPPSTVDTLLVESGAVGPVGLGRPTSATPNTLSPRKKGRLRRRARAAAVFSDDEEAARASSEDDHEEDEITADAFNVMKSAAAKAKARAAADAFDKKTSKAGAMVEEQAAESEDEYAGLGGASDDEETGELDEETRQMIEEGEVEVDERQLAAYHA